MLTFNKSERLSSKVSIDSLFEKGKSFNSFPFKVIWLEAEQSNTPAKIVISVPKRSFKRAVDRNRIKRQIREAYRKNKDSFYNSLDEKKVLLILIYTAKIGTEFKELEDKIIIALERLNKECNP
jgi:ribonuclease P protein component